MPLEDVIVYGPGGSSIPNNVVATEQVDTPQTLINERSVRDKARLALTANATYLALANPTAAQNTAQIKKLTRECSGLIRLLLNQLDDVSDT